jgi:hypothetical protein
MAIVIGTSLASGIDRDPNNWPDSITLQNKIIPTGGSVGNSNLGGEWYKDPTYTSEGTIIYRKSYPDGSYALYQISHYGEGHPVYAYLNHYNNDNENLEMWNIDWSGDSLDNMTLGSAYPNIDNPNFAPWFSENEAFFSNMASLVAGGLNETGNTFLTGGDPGPNPNPAPAPENSITQKALELNIGLIFEDGQWTPQN